MIYFFVLRGGGGAPRTLHTYRANAAISLGDIFPTFAGKHSGGEASLAALC